MARHMCEITTQRDKLLSITDKQPRVNLFGVDMWLCTHGEHDSIFEYDACIVAVSCGVMSKIVNFNCDGGAYWNAVESDEIIKAETAQQIIDEFPRKTDLFNRMFHNGLFRANSAMAASHKCKFAVHGENKVVAMMHANNYPTIKKAGFEPVAVLTNGMIDPMKLKTIIEEHLING